jgi:hypothetical protein
LRFDLMVVLEASLPGCASLLVTCLTVLLLTNLGAFAFFFGHDFAAALPLKAVAVARCSDLARVANEESTSVPQIRARSAHKVSPAVRTEEVRLHLSFISLLLSRSHNKFSAVF